MKKTFILLAIVFTIIIPLFANNNEIPLIFINSESKPTEIDRKPMHLPIEAFYDSDNNIVEVISDGSIEAEIFLYDANRNIIGYSSHLDTTFGLPIGYRGILILEINGENWYATAEIPV